MTVSRHVVVVDSDDRCADALRPHDFVVHVFANTEAAYRAIVGGDVDAVVVHVEETTEFDERIALVRRLQHEPATCQLPILVVITQQSDRASAHRTERFGSALLQLTTPDCTGVADAVEGLFDEPRFT
jgi:hypothetical protein